MPFKDPEKRREYHRNYMKRLREGLTNPSPDAPVTKCYMCLRYPDTMIVEGRRDRFQNGFYVTDDPEVQGHIETSEWFGKYIFGWEVEP